MDVSDRDKLEARLARILGRLLRTQMGQLMDLMGDPPRVDNVPSDYWREQGITFSAEIRPVLQRLFQDQAAAMIAGAPIGVDWALINERAIAWAQNYTFELVSGINATSRQTLQRAVSNYYRDALTIGDLEDMISGSFGPIRAEMIAVTEITRASARGEDAIVNELADQGIEMITVWNTNNDELVCPVCGPLDGKSADGRDNGEPYWMLDGNKITIPAHPRCRCFEANELPRANG